MLHPYFEQAREVADADSELIAAPLEGGPAAATVL